MKYKMYNINKLKEKIDSNNIYSRCRKNSKDIILLIIEGKR